MAEGVMGGFLQPPQRGCCLPCEERVKRPSPDAIRKVADANGLPVQRITEVIVLDPTVYQP
jgi:hypothetical protein